MDKEYVFKGLMIDVFSGPKNINLLTRFPILATYPEFTFAKNIPHININAAIRYVVAVYDKRGLRVYEESIQKRKKIAAELVGWRREDGKIEKVHLEILEGKNVAINRMVVRYLKIHKNVKYTSLVALEEAYFSSVLTMMDAATIKNADHQLFKNLESDIENRIVDFLSGDTNRNVAAELIDEIENEKLELRPEDVAKRLKDGLKLVNYNPYDGWIPSKLKLIPEENA
jgi:hypothetical protein